MNILQINSSARADGSHSTRLAGTVVDRLRAAATDGQAVAVTVRDLGQTPHPELNEATLQALFTPSEQRTPAQAARVALDDALIAELQAADVVVLGVPMYNFGVPAALKNWIDAISRAKVTFQYTANGPEGLLKNKKAFIASSRGGVYSAGSPGAAFEHQESYLLGLLAFLGVTDVTVVRAEGLAFSAQAKETAVARALENIADITF